MADPDEAARHRHRDHGAEARARLARAGQENRRADVPAELPRAPTLAERKLVRAGRGRHRLRPDGASRLDVPRERGGRGDFRERGAGDRARGFRADRGGLRARRQPAESGDGESRSSIGARRGEPQRILLTDAQTSGGLLLCVPEKSRGDAWRRCWKRRRRRSRRASGGSSQRKRRAYGCARERGAAAEPAVGGEGDAGARRRWRCRARWRSRRCGASWRRCARAGACRSRRRSMARLRDGDGRAARLAAAAGGECDGHRAAHEFRARAFAAAGAGGDRRRSAARYSNLEYDLAAGARGSRGGVPGELPRAAVRSRGRAGGEQLRRRARADPAPFHAAQSARC